MDPLLSLSNDWLATADTLARYGDERGAAVLRQVSSELCTALEGLATQTVSLRRAAAISDYHEDTLGRMVRDGTLTNYGKPNRPLVRVSELPRRPIARTRRGGENTAAVIRGIVTSKLGGH